MEDEFLLVTFAKKLGKNTSKLTFSDMFRYLEWLENDQKFIHILKFRKKRINLIPKKRRK